MSLIRYTPVRRFDSPFDRVFSEFLPALAHEGNGDQSGRFLPRVEIKESGDAILVTAEIPGVERESVKVEVHEGVLSLSGEKKEASESNENGKVRSERLYGTFERRFTLSKGVDAENINASYADGVLLVKLPKVPEAKPRQIAIAGGKGDAKDIDVS